MKKRSNIHRLKLAIKLQVNHKTSSMIIGTMLLLMFLSGCKHIYTDIQISAPPERVWAVLADIPNYPNWNPYHVRVEGDFKEGAKLSVTIHKPNGDKLTIEPHMIRIAPRRELAWGGGIKGLFHGEHVFLLERIGQGQTKLIHKEDFEGIFVPFASLETIEEGYRLMNEALKRRAEAIDED